MRSVVKHSYVGKAPGALKACLKHIAYIQCRTGEESRRWFFNDSKEGISRSTVVNSLKRYRDSQVIMHKLVISPGTKDVQIKQFTRTVMNALSSNKGLDLKWFGVEHHHTDHPHAHVVLLPRDAYDKAVRLTADNYTAMRAAGDAMLNRARLFERNSGVSRKDISRFDDNIKRTRDRLSHLQFDTSDFTEQSTNELSSYEPPATFGGFINKPFARRQKKARSTLQKMQELADRYIKRMFQKKRAARIPVIKLDIDLGLMDVSMKKLLRGKEYRDHGTI